ncbi:DUF6415 family natural product biosynthesis protein [Streptomyces sp. KL116D]|uniref:DUF6415 family natural product biosynthesis protein n=1 Tax=Streptomyces sp. KL116D TaxID=3045152 RepID=UPI00355825CB
MTTPATLASGWTHPVRAAAPLFGATRLAWIAQKIRRWAPYVEGQVLDDLAAVLDDYMPGEDQVDDLAQRLRGHHMRLSNRAVTTRLHERDEAVARLVDRGRTQRAEVLPRRPPQGRRASLHDGVDGQRTA